MIVALFALAAALVIGGSAAVVQGFPFVRLESGLAMVIAGASTASAGAILFGLGVVALFLKRVEKAFKEQRAAQAGPVPVPPVPALETVFPEPPRPSRPILPGLTGLAAGGAAGAASGAAQRPSEPTFEDGLFVPAEPDPRQPELPIPPPPEPRREPRFETAAPSAAPAAGVAPEDDLFAGPTPEEPAAAEAAPAGAAAPPPEEPPALRSSLDAAAPAPEPVEPVAPEPPAPAPAEAPPAEAPPAPAAEPPREVVGKYASGGNTYVMYADGSIEAETPRGRFSFASLDELKAFIDAGGEGAARGAA